MKSKSKAKFQVRNQNVTKKLNPFEVHINRSKHQVLGRKLKSDHGLPGISKNKALQKRKKTLLQEYKTKDKLNNFIDQRIGGTNSSMTEDDRIMARFAAERMKRYNKKTMFNLSDSNEITHRGQTLSEIERFDDVRSDDEDEEDRGKSGALKKKFVEEAHFGGGLLTQSKQDRGSLIDELINESKKRKAERQRNKEETLEATEQLDEEWKTLGLMVTSKTETQSIEDVRNAQKKDDYDIVMRRLKFEPQAQASQRLKTDEEIAKEDKEQLEMLEKERLKQLREVEAVKYGKHRSADDLDDGFSYQVEDVNDDLKSKTEKTESSDSSSESDETASEDEGEEESEDDENNSDEDSKSQLENDKLDTKKNVSNEAELNSNSEEAKKVDSKGDDELKENDDCNEFPTEIEAESSDEECAMDDLTDLMPSGIEENNIDSQLIAKVLAKAKSGETSVEINTEEGNEIIQPSIDLDLPYILNVPDTYESFKDLLNKHSVNQQNVIFERLVKSNHPSLDPGNKKQMFRLAEYILDHVNEGNVLWKEIPTLAMHFGGIKEFNRVECLKMLIERITMRLDDFSHTSLKIPAVKCLVWYILLLLKPQGMDVLLPVSRPVLGLACKLVSHADPAVSSTIPLLCCCLLHQDAKSSCLLYTEAVIYLHKCVQFTMSKNCSILSVENTSESPSESTTLQSSSCQSKKINIAEDLKLHLLDQEDEEEDPTVKVSQIFYCSTVLLAGFVKVYRKYPQSKILFRPIYESYKQIKADQYPPTLKQKVEELQTLLEVLQSASLPPVTKTAKKPKVLRQYEPSFHSVTIVGRSQRGLPAEKQEEQKLLHKYKQEKKGALRELRRDRSFLASIKLRETAQSDEQRKRKVKEILGSAAAQQGELRSLKKKK